MCALRVNRLHTGFHYFLLEVEVLAHRLRIALSGNDAPKIVPEKGLGSDLVIQNGCNRKFVNVNVALTFCLASLWSRGGS